MAKTRASAPGKVILFGEHAVVYGQPALAAPVSQVRAAALVEDSREAGVLIRVPSLGHHAWLSRASDDDPLAATVRLVEATAGRGSFSGLSITIEGNIPIASGMGSGAAVAAAMIRALVRHLKLRQLDNPEEISRLTYEVECLHHGTPSGIDNTVVTYEQPVFFQRGGDASAPSGNLIMPLPVAQPVHLLVADTGIRSSTKEVVGDVRARWQADRAGFETIFAHCGRLALAARDAIEAGDIAGLGDLMNENHKWLQAMTVSSRELDRLVTAARVGGAQGAKLSGGGRGGNMIALVTAVTEEAVRQALQAAGARAVLTSFIPAT